MLPAGWKPIRLLHSPSLDIHENGTSLYNLKKKKKGWRWFVPKEWLDFNILNNNKKSFVYIKIDIARVNTVSRRLLENLFWFSTWLPSRTLPSENLCRSQQYNLSLTDYTPARCKHWEHLNYPTPFDSEENTVEVCSRHFYAWFQPYAKQRHNLAHGACEAVKDQVEFLNNKIGMESVCSCCLI